MKLDRRARYTREALKKSLLELMRYKPFLKITVKALCEEADINRATFYSHYESIEDLLKEIEDEFYHTVKQTLANTNLQFNIHSVLVQILESIIEQRELCRVLLSPFGNKHFLESLLLMAYEQFIKELSRRFPHITPVQMERVYAFYSQGSVSVITLWIRDGMKETPDDVASFIVSLTEDGMRSLRNARR